MKKIDFNNKTFSLIENSEKGKVNLKTKFEYKQDGNLVTADYHGGTIVYGKIIALLNGNQLDMRYQCFTTANELKTGSAIAEISILENGKLRLKLDWKWLDDSNETGISEYLEN